MGTTGQAEIKEAAERYAETEMGRAVEVVAVLDHGSAALALCRAKDGDESFALHLVAAIASHAWSVMDETTVEDFSRNAHSDNAFEAARIAASLLEDDLDDYPEGPAPEPFAGDESGFVVRLAGGAFLGGPKARFATRFDAAEAACRAGYETTSTPMAPSDAVIERAERS